MYIYMHVYIYIHVYIYTCIHTQMLSLKSSFSENLKHPQKLFQYFIFNKNLKHYHASSCWYHLP